MKKLLAVAVAALALAPGASAHYGDLWFQSASVAAENIEIKHPTVAMARCNRLDSYDLRRYGGHSRLYNDGVRRWDHFRCGLALHSGSACFTIVHITGARWSDFYLSSYYYRGCTPYQLRR